MKKHISAKYIIIFLTLILLLFYACMASLPGKKPDLFATLEVVTYNIGDLNGQRPDTMDIIRVIKANSSPDIILLQEVGSENQARLIADDLGMGHTAFNHLKDKRCGLAILSRYPIRDKKFYPFKSSENGHGFLSAEIMIEGHIILATSVHLDRIALIDDSMNHIHMTWFDGIGFLIKEMIEETPRSSSVDELIEKMDEKPYRDRIIGGDFNTVSWSKTIRKMTRCYKDALGSISNGFKGTYRKTSLPIEPRIDFIFHSESIECFRADIIRESPGDHYPVRAALNISKK